jgi:hypothetical protein
MTSCGNRSRVSDAATWTIELETRQDALSIFVPVAALAQASVGDHVVIHEPGRAHGDGTRTGIITVLTEDPVRGDFWSVEIDWVPPT